MSISMKINVDRPSDFWHIVDRLPNTQKYVNGIKKPNGCVL